MSNSIRLVCSSRVPAVATLMLLLCMFSAASAQDDPYYLFDAKLTSTVEANGLQLQIQFEGLRYSANQWTATPAGMDVYRSNIGVACDSWERITEVPVVWDWIEDPGEGPHLEFELLDVTAEPNHGYMYKAVAVDADRKAIPENPDAYLGPATHGVALLGHGFLFGGGGGCGQSYRQDVLNCRQECFPALMADASTEVAPHLNSGTRVFLYGTVTGVTSFCGTNEYIGFFTSAVPGDCIVSVEQETWSNLKQFYR